MTVRSYAGAAKRTTLSAGISNSALSFTVTAGGGSGYPTGADGPFVVLLDHDTAGEEKALCSGRTGDTFTVQTGGRGYDDTIASAHGLNAPVDHVGTAMDFREANQHVNNTTGDPHPQYLTSVEADALFLTPAEGDAAYVVRAEAKGSRVDTSESTASTTYTDLTTSGPAVTVLVPASGRVKVTLGCAAYNSDTTTYSGMSVALSGANVFVANDSNIVAIISHLSTVGPDGSKSYVLTGLTPGSTTFTAKYKVGGGAGTFARRTIDVIPL